ncbi:MAG: hypothetical protein Q8K55_16380 [Gemmatimonadaceae bacterium]|nr:hypothetical protein [Gemmatimonadaceae bacterium]
MLETADGKKAATLSLSPEWWRSNSAHAMLEVMDIPQACTPRSTATASSAGGSGANWYEFWK